MKRAFLLGYMLAVSLLAADELNNPYVDGEVYDYYEEDFYTEKNITNSSELAAVCLPAQVKTIAELPKTLIMQPEELSYTEVTNCSDPESPYTDEKFEYQESYSLEIKYW